MNADHKVRYGHDVKSEDDLKYKTDSRIAKLKAKDGLKWPRLTSGDGAVTIPDFLAKYTDLRPGDRRDNIIEILHGRVMSLREAGAKLLFLDIHQDGQFVQAVCNYSDLNVWSGTSFLLFKQFCQKVQRGDIISVTGTPLCSATSKGELSLMCRGLPIILSPSISLIPRTLKDPEVLARNRHLDMLIHDRMADTIRIRSHIIQSIRNFLLDDQFYEVQTPILAHSAGGAAARPFTTVATEFSEKKVALRVAPEIWLKRLVIGGMDRVFEIGPAFRNEGLDATHNPEFTTCEFYKAFATLSDLMTMTEKMIGGIANVVSAQLKFPLKSLPEPDAKLSETPYKRVEFIPALEAALGDKLPDLSKDSARTKLLALCKKHHISIPGSLTLPRILDKLASIYIEPQCEAPTYVINHPACMAPLAKSFLDPQTQQIVSARAELFIRNLEIANMYEEENSPFEQKEKFVQQAKYKDDENTADIDKSYLEALEWGLPPTGGWGCGIDRMVMLFSGASRMSDVLSFGSLRNVVNLGNPAPRATGVAKKLEGSARAGGIDEIVPAEQPAKKKKQKKKRKPTSESTITANDASLPEHRAAQAEAGGKSDEAAPPKQLNPGTEDADSPAGATPEKGDTRVGSKQETDQLPSARKLSGAM